MKRVRSIYAQPHADSGTARVVVILVLIIWTLGWTAIVGGFDWMCATRLAQQLRTYGFEATHGEIEFTKVG